MIKEVYNYNAKKVVILRCIKPKWVKQMVFNTGWATKTKISGCMTWNSVNTTRNPSLSGSSSPTTHSHLFYFIEVWMLEYVLKPHWKMPNACLCIFQYQHGHRTDAHSSWRFPDAVGAEGGLVTRYIYYQSKKI